jgi:hypothetical protein
MKDWSIGASLFLISLGIKIKNTLSPGMSKMLKPSLKFTMPSGKKNLQAFRRGSFKNFHSLAKVICRLYVHFSEDLLHSKLLRQLPKNTSPSIHLFILSFQRSFLRKKGKEIGLKKN